MALAQIASTRDEINLEGGIQIEGAHLCQM